MSPCTRVVARAGANLNRPNLARALKSSCALPSSSLTHGASSRRDPRLVLQPRISHHIVSGTRHYSISQVPEAQIPVRPLRVHTTDFLVDVAVERQSSLGVQGEEIWSMPKLWLRDICPCPQCQSPSSGQKRFATCDLNQDVSPKSVELKEDGSLQIEWENDSSGSNHSSVYPLEYLTSRYHASTHHGSPTLPDRIVWVRKTFEQGLASRNVEYADWMQGGAAYCQALQTLSAYGLVVVKNVPESEESVQRVGERIGPLMDTFYGFTWDVISKPDAENVAYTSEFLPLHQDLMYHDPIPKIQLLHCLKNECAGGDSLFSDGLYAAYNGWIRSRDEFKILRDRQLPIAYWYTKNGNHRYRTHSVIDVTDLPHPIPLATNWSPPFQAPLPLDHLVQHGPRAKPTYEGSEDHIPVTIGRERLSNWMAATKKFRALLEDPANMWQYKMEPGDCVVFDNRRVLHGRTQFEPSRGGQRHLRGAYLDEPTFDRARRQYVGAGKPYRIAAERKTIFMAEVAQARAILNERMAAEKIARKQAICNASIDEAGID